MSAVDFNPQRGPIVRVQAYEIRRLLKKYYEEDGKTSTIRMDLPTGHYVPIFRRNAEQESALEAPPTQPILAKRPGSLRWALTAVLGILSVVLAGLLFLSRGVQRGQS